MSTITSLDYDRRVTAEGLQFQAGHFYEPRHPADRRRIEIVMTHAAPEKGQMILDIGCGTGAFAFHCSRRGAVTLGIDYSFESLKAARSLCASYDGAARFVAANASAFPVKDGRFDCCIASDFIEHTTHNEKIRFLEQARSALRDDGRCVIFTPNKMREDIAAFCGKVRHVLSGRPMPVNELHFGLTGRRSFEKLLTKRGFVFTFRYYDVTRPFLARIPGLRRFLALNLLWVARKKIPSDNPLACHCEEAGGRRSNLKPIIPA